MFKLSEQYILRAVLYLGNNPDRWFTGYQIAKTLKLPSDYLTKLLVQLSRYGVLEARRGRNGGFKLKSTPKSLSIKTILKPFNFKSLSKQCLLGEQKIKKLCGTTSICILHEKIKSIMESFDEILANLTLKELILQKDNGGIK